MSNIFYSLTFLMPPQDIVTLLPNYLVNSQLYYIAVVGLDGCYAYVNSCFEQRFSFITDDFIGKHSYIAIYHEDHAKCEVAVQECFTHPDKTFSLILRKPNTSINDFYWTQWEFSILKDAQQTTIGVLCIGHDITYSKRLSHEEYLLKAVYDCSNEPNVFADTNLIIRYRNLAAKHHSLIYFEKELEVGTHLLDFTLPHHREGYLELCNKALNGETVKGEWANGDDWWLTIMFPVYDNEGKIVGITVNAQDISERKHKEQQIIRQNISLRSIAWKQSHEVRRPLANILGLCTLLKIDDVAALEDRLLYIDYLIAAAEELDTIIQEIISESNKT